jgi:hypothetical protein
VITGSHNWTTSATARNDENTLIIHDGDITNIFRQEFEARWAEISTTGTTFPESISALVVSPSPVSTLLRIVTVETIDEYSIWSMSGLLVRHGSVDEVLDVSELSEGMYLLTVQFANGHRSHCQFVKY